jgi:ABC-2 type transport system permease protein
MPVFNATIKSLRKFLPTILIHIGVFLLFSILYTKLNSDSTAEIFREKELKLLVVDAENSTLSKNLIRFLSEDEKVTVRHEERPDKNELRSINDAIRFDVYDYALLLPENFSRHVLAGDSSAAEYIASGSSASGELLSRKINSYIKNVVIYLNSGYSADQASRRAASLLRKASSPEVRIAKTNDAAPSSSIASIYSFLSYSLLSMIVLSIGLILRNIREHDLHARISVSGTGFFTRYTALSAAVFVIAAGITLIVNGFALFFTHSGLQAAKSALFVLNSFSLMPVGVGFAFLVSSVTQNDGLINMLTNMVMIPMCFISGIFVPTEFLSAQVIAASRFLPLYWYIQNIHRITESPAGVYPGRNFTLGLIIQLLFAAVLFCAGLVISRKKELYAV